MKKRFIINYSSGEYSFCKYSSGKYSSGEYSFCKNTVLFFAYNFFCMHKQLFIDLMIGWIWFSWKEFRHQVLYHTVGRLHHHQLHELCCNHHEPLWHEFKMLPTRNKRLYCINEWVDLRKGKVIRAQLVNNIVNKRSQLTIIPLILHVEHHKWLSILFHLI